MPDRNWKSYVGPEDNGKTIDSFENPPNQGEGYDDVFKCSNVENLKVVGIQIEAQKAREDGIDCVRGRNYQFEGVACRGSITVKGGIDGFEFRGGLIERVVELGQFDNYWFPGRPPTKNVMLANTCKPDGGEIHVVLWDAEPPFIVNTRINLWKVPKFIWFPYFLFRYVWIRLC